MKKYILQIVKIKNLKIQCPLHGSQKIVQATKYGSGECEKCLKDIEEYLNSKRSAKT